MRRANEFPNDLAILFTEQDRRVEKIQDPAISGLQSDDSKSASQKTKTTFVASTSVIRSRLDFLGFTLAAASDAFDFGKHKELEELDELIERLEGQAPGEQNPFADFIEHQKERRKDLQSHTFSSWVESLKDPDAHLQKAVYHPVIAIEASDSQYEDRFPGGLDARHHLRCELEVIGEQNVILDISGIVEGAGISILDLGECSEEVNQRDRTALRLIVLTEGSTDKFILEHAINLLNPAVKHFISFLEFEVSRIAGGIPFLMQMVKSFAAAGIRDRIVAVFDNDTAGCLALQQLRQCKLPRNIRVIQYPNIDIAKSYPTLGPTGLTNMDVNECAASIELYLSADVLSDNEGSYFPIQWKGFEPTLKRYQGEVLNKGLCLQRFKEKVAAAKGKNVQTDSSWKELRMVVNALSTSFVDLDRELLLNEARAVTDS